MWHPIDTAPRNGVHVLVKTADRIELGCYFEEEGSWFARDADGQPYEIFPEHWRPVPASAKACIWFVPLMALPMVGVLVWWVVG